jgi:hypothetical protein
MAKMYIANCTNQVQDFQYRLPESNKIYKQPISIGDQIRLSGDLSTPDIEAIISQHQIYGLVPVSEIDRSKDFVGLCWQLDRPIDVEKVKRALAVNMRVLDARGKEIRKEAAVAVSNSVEAELSNTPDRLKALEFSIEEQPNKDGRDIQVNEQLRVTRDPSQAAPKPPRRRTA